MQPQPLIIKLESSNYTLPRSILRNVKLAPASMFSDKHPGVSVNLEALEDNKASIIVPWGLSNAAMIYV